MNTRSALIALAATLCPLQAAQETPSQVVSSMLVAAPTPAAVSLQDRAAAFPALQALPKDVEGFFALGNIAEMAQALAKNPIISAIDPLAGEKLLAYYSRAPITSIAFGMAPGSAEMLKYLQDLNMKSTVGMIALLWQLNAKPEVAEMIAAELAKMSAASYAGDIAPLYMSVSVDSKAMAQIQPMIDQLESAMVQNIKEPFKIVSINGMRGVMMPGSAIPADAMESIKTAMGEQVATTIASKDYYLLYKQVANTIQFAVTTDPAQVKSPSSVEDSALASEGAAVLDAQLKNGLFAAAHFNASLAQIISSYDYSALAQLGQVFNQMAAKDAANKDSLTQAANFVAAIATNLTKMYEGNYGACTMTAWADKDLNFQATGIYPEKFAMKPAAMTGLGVLSSSTALYAEMSPMSLPAFGMSGKEIVQGTLNLANAVALTLPAEDQMQMQQGLAAMELYMPYAEKMMPSICATLGSLSGSFGLYIDGKGTLGDMSIPRAAIFAGLADKAQLKQGWAEFTSNVDQLLGMFGAPINSKQLPVASTFTPAGELTSCTIPLVNGQIIPDLTPSLLVNDKFVSLSNAPALLNELARGEGATMAGAVFVLRFEPIAQTLQSLSTQDPSMKKAADGMQQASQFVEGIYGTATQTGTMLRYNVKVKAK